MGTRYVHQVRIKKVDNTQSPPAPDADTFVDVEVTDAISFVGANGVRMIIDFSNLTTQVPYIVDNTDANLGAGNANSATRQSHIEKIVSPADSTTSLYIEVLDIASFKSPNGNRGFLNFPSSDAGYTVDDRASVSIANTTSRDGHQTRRGHTIKVTADDNADPANEQSDFLAVLTTDAISLVSPNGERNILNLDAYDVIDRTQYTQDDNGKNVPPDNTDPNPYVKFPDDSNSPWVQIGDGSNPMGPIGCAMGPLWRIVNAKGNNGPWWIYTKEYQPYQWSSIGYNYCWQPIPFTAERCFPYCLPCTCGCDTFATDVVAPACVEGKNMRWPCIGHDVNVGCGGTDPGPTATLPKVGFATDNEAAKYAAETDPGACVKVNFKEPPQDRFTYVGLAITYSGWRPNVWQITKGKDDAGNDLVQPSHTDPNTGDTIYDNPSSTVAKKVAKLLEQQWNDTTDAYNAGEVAMEGCNKAPCCNWYSDNGGFPEAVWLGRSYPSEADDWKFGCAIVDGATSDIHTIGRPDLNSNALDFCGGLPPAGWIFGKTDYPCGVAPAYRIWAFHPATAWPIAVVQLDKKVWDVSGDTPKLLPRPPDLADGAPWPPA